MPYSIRLATLADVPALSDLAERTFVETFGPTGFDVPYPEADLSGFLAASYAPEKVAGWIADPRGHVLVAEDSEGRLVGYAQSGANELPLPGAAPGDGELKRIYVVRAAQGTGLGRDLLERSLAWLGDRPILIGVWSLNLKALRLYGHYGFERAGEYEFAVGESRDAEFILRRLPR